MLISEAYSLLQKFCVQALNDPKVTVLDACQFSSRPKKPCVVIDINNCKDVGVFSQSVDAQGVKTFNHLKTIDVTFTAYSDKTTAADDLLCTIYNMLSTELTFAVFGRSIALLKNLIDVTSSPSEVSGVLEDRSLMELRFNITQSATYTVGLIEHVEIHDQINNTVYIVDI